MPLDQQATAKDLSPLTMDTYHKCPLSGSKVPLFFLFIIGFTRRDNGQLCWTKYIYIYLFIYIFFAVLSSQRRKTFPFLCQQLGRQNVSAKKVPKFNSNSVLAEGDLGTELVFSHCLKTFCAGALLFNKNKFAS